MDPYGGVTTSRIYVFPATSWLPTPPTNHPYVITCGIGEKLSKMAGNSTSKPMKSIPNKLPCITVDWWRIAWKTLCAFSRYTAFNIFKSVFQSKYLYKTLFANPVTYIHLWYSHLSVFSHIGQPLFQIHQLLIYTDRPFLSPPSLQHHAQPQLVSVWLLPAPSLV